MHERAAVTSALTQLMADSGGNLTRVVAAVGPGVDRAVVTAIWDEVVAGTGAEAAVLVCETEMDQLRCLVCGADYGGGKLDPCPECGGDGLVVAKAPEFDVRSWMGGS